ncbi:hypothetical protein NXX23_17850 [Bacteroides ovatus]|nr:hypothetical protein [Bacteroides ovatus]
MRSVYGSLLEIGEFDLIISFANPMVRRGLDNDDRNAQRLHLHGGLSRVTAG